MRSFRFALVLFLLASGLARPALAWNETGHETVAQVAFDHLTPAARQKWCDLLEQHPRRDKDLLPHLQPGDDRALTLFLIAATWPDVVRNPIHPLMRSENHPQWHYVTMPFNQGGAAGPPPVLTWNGSSLPVNLIQAMQKVTTEIVAADTPAARRAIDLCWIEHLTGDIHQPLHAVSLFIPALPAGDRGGNSVLVASTTMPRTNLHFVWDYIEGYAVDPRDCRPDRAGPSACGAG